MGGLILGVPGALLGYSFVGWGGALLGFPLSFFLLYKGLELFADIMDDALSPFTYGLNRFWANTWKFWLASAFCACVVLLWGTGS